MRIGETMRDWQPVAQVRVKVWHGHGDVYSGWGFQYKVTERDWFWKWGPADYSYSDACNRANKAAERGGFFWEHKFDGPRPAETRADPGGDFMGDVP